MPKMRGAGFYEDILPLLFNAVSGTIFEICDLFLIDSLLDVIFQGRSMHPAFSSSCRNEPPQ
jgi:hypothetical protein